MIRVTVEGVAYDFDGDHVLLAEARELKTYTKLTLPRWNQGLDEMDPDAVQFLIFLAKKRAGESLRYSDLDTLDFADIDLELVEPEPDEPENAGEAAAATDPTPPPDTGTTPTAATSPTSDASPTTSSTPPPPSTP